MNNATEALAAQLNTPYEERWGLLKDILARLYIDEKKAVKDIVEIMKADYRFYASVNQYKRQFGLWNMKRALTTKKKAKISKELETRAQQGKYSVVLHNGKVETGKMRRFMKEQKRREISIWTNISNGAVDIEKLFGHALQCGNRVFMNWNIPAAVFEYLNSRITNHVSPNASVGTPMSGVLVATPSSYVGPSPRDAPSPSTAMSPNNERSAMMTAIRENVKINRAHLFVQKHHKDLLQGMDPQEQIITIDWMHQFWQFSFRTAKTWGRGPHTWDSSSLGFNQFFRERDDNLPGTPALNMDSTNCYPDYQPLLETFQNGCNTQRPSALCRWSIHAGYVDYIEIPSPQRAETPVDPVDEDTWRPWKTEKTIEDFANSLKDNLESNDFSTIKVEELPISASQIARAANRSPEQLLEEAFGFSIMGRNLILVSDMLGHIKRKPDFSLHGIFPLHLASSYLDGAKACCGIFSEIVMRMSVGEASVRKLYINHLNHTVLDNLMITILKAHTSCKPVMVDVAFKDEHRFAGEEVDICGRWDADSDCIRHLQGRGNPCIPQDWKHMFCHTSIQAITHCIGTLFSPHWAPDINTPSGLFLKRCANETCGQKLELKPLHTLVVTAVYLAQFGSDEENMFGMIACLLCLLGKGANPLLKADVSISALLTNNDSQECSHSALDPFELAQKVPEDLISNWPQERIIGWKIFCNIIGLSRNEWDPQAAYRQVTNTSVNDFEPLYSDFIENPIANALRLDIDEESESTDYDEDEDEDEDYGPPVSCIDHENYGSYGENYFGRNENLATLWAAVQTELLTYRRISEGDSWISSNFDMKSVLKTLEMGGEFSIGLVSKNMMKPYCQCGIFHKSEDVACPRVEEASAYYFSNLEDWNRSSFIDGPYGRHVSWSF